MIVCTVRWAGALDAGEVMIEPLRRLGPPVLDSIGVIPYTALQRMLDPLTPTRLRYYRRAPTSRS